ncbi:MAG: hypothetical protein Q8P30_01625 [Candidatus Uhrbacteria bacterium]|nr:hypothetical protein [Candidatus Uhrbacteria bacterium]
MSSPRAYHTPISNLPPHHLEELAIHDEISFEPHHLEELAIHDERSFAVRKLRHISVVTVTQ